MADNILHIRQVDGMNYYWKATGHLGGIVAEGVDKFASLEEAFDDAKAHDLFPEESYLIYITNRECPDEPVRTGRAPVLDNSVPRSVRK